MNIGMMMKNGTMDDMMHMTFYAGTNATILFTGWKTTNWQTLFGSCIAVFIVAILYEGLKAFRRYLIDLIVIQRTGPTTTTTTASESNTSSPDDHLLITTVPAHWTNKYSRQSVAKVLHIVQTILHFVQVAIGYLLMLVTMTFNVYLFLSVVGGASVGYLLFNYKRPIIVDANEHCH